MANPIKPDDVIELRKKFIPDEVIKAFNEAIVEKWNGKSATINQDYIVNKIKQKLEIDSGDFLFDNHYLDVEDIFRGVGWIVVYDKPGYNETYSATFEFRKK